VDIQQQAQLTMVVHYKAVVLQEVAAMVVVEVAVTMVAALVLNHILQG